MAEDSQALQYMQRTLTELEECVQAMSKLFAPPLLVVKEARAVFRYRAVDDRLLTLLKCVRAVSILNAALVLLRAGHIHEVYALCRIVDEINEDVTFMSSPLEENDEPSEDQQRYFDEFIQEEFEDERDVLGSQAPRDRVSRRRIRAAIANMKGHPGNPSDVIAMGRTLYQVFSGYVHSAYVHIMESYGGHAPGHFHTGGMLGTPKIQECEEVLPNYIFRTICSAEIVAARLENQELKARLRKLRGEFAATTGCVPKDAKQAKATMDRIRGKGPARAEQSKEPKGPR